MRALPEQSLQRGPESPEVQALSGLRAHQPLPEGQLLHHQQCRVRGLPAGVRACSKKASLLSVSAGKPEPLCL